MNETGQAVFLSYASQDAEAARRIAEALRAAGVEVWFDQSELVGGDAWDAKIRKQIGSCALFVPIISANTQARREGYFRLEWRLAVERMRQMDDDLPFLVPVVIDDTRDADAYVPDRFREVQWTRLPLQQAQGGPGGDRMPAFCDRVQRLLGGGTSSRESSARAPTAARGEGAPAPAKARRRWAGPVIAGGVALVAVGVWLAVRQTGTGAPVAGSPAAAPSEARRLVARAWEQLNKPELARAELEIADGFCRRAVELDPNDAEAWAAWSQTDSWTVYHNLDRSPARREGARTKAAKALQLAPSSFEARLAHACQLVRGEGDRQTSLYAAEAARLLRALLEANPDEPRALLALGILQRNTGDAAGFRDTFGRLARNPAFAAVAWNELGWAEYFAGDYRAASAAIEVSIARQPYWGNLGLKAILAQWWFGDLDQAKATVDRMPAAVLQEDIGVSFRIELAYWRREPQAMLQVLADVPRDWLSSNNFDGPTAALAALAHRMAGREAAAQVQLLAALRLVEARLAARPDSGVLLFWKGRLLALLGRRPEAAEVFRLARELGGVDSDIGDPVVERVLLSDAEGALDAIGQRLETGGPFGRQMFAAYFRLNPRFDPLRGNPRFDALLARIEADPRCSPGAMPAAATGPAAAPGMMTDSKSVAVLAFANLSDDKANEYFSDGISEELLNVLAKVPGLKVSARTSAFFFKGKEVPIPEIAKQLGVAYVVEGSVRKQGDKVRITAQLIKASDGFHVWSDTFTRDLKDIFAVQDEIAGLIAGNLQLKLGFAPGEGTVTHPEASGLFFDALAAWDERGPRALARARLGLEEALRLEPRFARAMALLALVMLVETVTPVDGVADRALALAENALAIDASLATAHAARGLALDLLGRPAEAVGELRRAVELDPNYASGHQWLGRQMLAVGEMEASLVYQRRAAELDPLSHRILDNYAQVLANAGRFEQALAVIERALRLQPDSVQAKHFRARYLGELGRWEEAESVMKDPAVAGRSPQTHALILRRMGRKAEALAVARAVAEPFRRGLALCAAGAADEGWPLLRPQTTLQRELLLWNLPHALPRNNPAFLRALEEWGMGEAWRKAEAWRSAHAPEGPGAKP